MNFKQLFQKYFGVKVPDTPPAIFPQNAIAPNCGVSIVSGPCLCARCRASMLTVVSQLAFRDVAKRRFNRHLAILPPPPRWLVAYRIKARIESEVANYATN